MRKVKNIFLELCYNIIWSKEILVISWSLAILGLFCIYAGYSLSYKVSVLLSETEYQEVEGTISDIKVHHGAAGFGTTSSYVKIELTNGKTCFITNIFDLYDWNDMLKNVHSGDEIQLLTYSLGNDEYEPRIIAIFHAGEEILSVKAGKDAYKMTYDSAQTQMKIGLFIGPILCIFALVITIIRRF